MIPALPVKEQFFHRETYDLLKLLDQAAARAGTSRGTAFTDFLELVVCTLSGGEMEEQYLSVVKRYAAGEQGKRAIDSITALFGNLVRIMDETRADILGDLFAGAITYGEAGQFLTPETISDLMAKMLVTEDETPRERVFDCCCGSGRMLLSAAKENRHSLFIGQDIDLRCVRMTAINLALRNLYGFVIWGDALRLEQKLTYQTGFNGKGVIRELKPVAPSPSPEPETTAACAERELPQDASAPTESAKLTQRQLFDME